MADSETPSVPAKPRRNTWPRAALPFAVLAVFGAGAFISIPIAVSYLKERGAGYSDVVFPMILVAGVVALLATLAIVVGLFKALDLANGDFALGMPDGSIRAVIALMLILLFGMMAVFLYIDSAVIDARELIGVSQERVDEVPGDELISVRPSVAAPGLFDVTRRVQKSAVSADIAKQLVTTVSTLVVAIAAFYFGSQSVGSIQRTSGQSIGRDVPGPSAPGTTQDVGQSTVEVIGPR